MLADMVKEIALNGDLLAVDEIKSDVLNSVFRGHADELFI